MKLFKFAVLVLIIVLQGCRTAPLYNPSIEFTNTNINKVEEAILTGLANRQWLIKKDHPNMIIGILNLREHQATIQISYTPHSYAIHYMNSKELLYERKSNGNEVIHKNYNSWIKYLVNDINTLLAIPSPVD
jgi:hypothetical protein